MAAEVMVLFGEKLVTCEGTFATHGLPIPAVTLTGRKGSKWEAHFPVGSWSAGNPCWGALGQVTGDRPSSAS